MDSKNKLADALRRVINTDVGGTHYYGAKQHNDAIRDGLVALAEHDASNTPPPDFKIAIFVRGGVVEDVAATVPFLYEVIDADVPKDDDEEDALNRWDRITDGWICP